jgi:hypothetical protein
MGRPGAERTCAIKVEIKDGAYFRHNGALEEEPVAAFRQWMEKHQYDPEHGKNEPVNTAGTSRDVAGKEANSPQ